jgi:hypothetical protein
MTWTRPYMRVVDFVEIIPKIASIIATTKLYQINYELVKMNSTVAS